MSRFSGNRLRNCPIVMSHAVCRAANNSRIIFDRAQCVVICRYVSRIFRGRCGVFSHITDGTCGRCARDARRLAKNVVVSVCCYSHFFHALENFQSLDRRPRDRTAFLDHVQYLTREGNIHIYIIFFAVITWIRVISILDIAITKNVYLLRINLCTMWKN